MLLPIIGGTPNDQLERTPRALMQAKGYT